MEELVLKGKTLLVVDDEGDLREIISSELEFMGAQVYQAENVSAAKSIIDEHQVDLVISDIRMPGGTGVDLLKYIKSKNLNAPPVMLITGFADISVEDAFDIGAEALLNKPFKLDELIYRAVRLTNIPEIRFRGQPNDVSKELNFAFTTDLKSKLSSHELLIGRGGLSIVTNAPHFKWDIGDEVRFNFKFNDVILSGVGICRWWKVLESENSAILGLEFINLSDDTYNILEKYWQEHATVPFIPSLH